MLLRCYCFQAGTTAQQLLGVGRTKAAGLSSKPQGDNDESGSIHGSVSQAGPVKLLTDFRAGNPEHDSMHKHHCKVSTK